MFGLFGKKRIYLDYASSTPISTESARAMKRAHHIIGNPGSIHTEGVKAKESLAASRATLARDLGCKPRDVIFTSGITESNNLAILGFAKKLQAKGKMRGSHWIVSAIEHASILECFSEVARLGGEVSYVYPDVRGIIQPESIARTVSEDTVFVSIGWANNEIGTIQPLSAISHVLREREKAHGSIVILHTDAGQAPLYESPQVHTLGVDLFSFGAGKLYGPHGIGALYMSTRAELSPIMFGGGQERTLRSGTENVALAAGFAEALRVAANHRQSEARRLLRLRDALAREIGIKLPQAVVNGDIKHALPHMLNISIPGIESEYLMLRLDREGIAISTKSACAEGEQPDSHVVKALADASTDPQKEAWRASHALRFSLGRATNASDLSHLVDILRNIF